MIYIIRHGQTLWNGESGSPDRIRGGTDIELAPAGHDQAVENAANIQAEGPLHKVYASDKKRTQQTASKFNAPVLTEPALRDMNYGSFEGQKSDDVWPAINKFITQMPNEPMPGVSPTTGHEGQSFNEYKQQLLGFMQKLMQNDSPDQRQAVVLNRRSVKTLQGWLKMGATPDLAIDNDTVTGNSAGCEPGCVHKLINQSGKWKLQPVDFNASRS